MNENTQPKRVLMPNNISCKFLQFSVQIDCAPIICQLEIQTETGVISLQIKLTNNSNIKNANKYL